MDMTLIEDVKRARAAVFSYMDKGKRIKMKDASLTELVEFLVSGIRYLRETNERLRDAVNKNDQEYDLVESAKRLKESLAEFMGLPMPDDGES